MPDADPRRRLVAAAYACVARYGFDEVARDRASAA